MISVSIIIPTYNRLKYLITALESCLRQTVLPQKIIIGDDSLNNETEEWIKLFKSQQSVDIMYIHNNPALKQAGNVEMLMQKVDTDYLLLLHDDDCLLNNALENLVNIVRRHRAVDVAFGKQYLIDVEGRINKQASEWLNCMFHRTENEEGFIKDSKSVILRQQLPSNSFLVRTSLAQKLHYGEKEKAGNGVDFHFCYKLGLEGATFYYTNKYISCYRDSPDGISKFSDSGFQAFRLIREMPVESELEMMKEESLVRLAPIAIMQAIGQSNREEAKAIYFSKYHRKKILSLGGIRRGLKLMFA